MATYLLGIDVSTTATKALLIDEAGLVTAVGACEYPFETPKPLWSEQDPALWWEGTVQAIRAVLPKGTPVYAVGGAGPDNFAAWMKASADGFGIGTALYTPGLSVDEVRQRAQRIVAAFDAAKGGA